MQKPITSIRNQGDIDKQRSLQAALETEFTVQEIRDRIKTNEDHILQLFVKRLHLENLPPLEDPTSTRNQTLNQLASCLITSEGKKKASSILGAQTFQEMYQKRQRNLQRMPANSQRASQPKTGQSQPASNNNMHGIPQMHQAQVLGPQPLSYPPAQVQNQFQATTSGQYPQLAQTAQHFQQGFAPTFNRSYQVGYSNSRQQIYNQGPSQVPQQAQFSGGQQQSSAAFQNSAFTLPPQSQPTIHPIQTTVNILSSQHGNLQGKLAQSIQKPRESSIPSSSVQVIQPIQTQNTKSIDSRDQIQKQESPCRSDSQSKGAIRAPQRLSQQKILQTRERRIEELTASFDMFQLPYDKLELNFKQSGYPSFFDPEKYVNVNVSCYCDRPKELLEQHLMIECTFCGKYSHKQCNGLNVDMPKFVCASCQLQRFDPLSRPIYTLQNPFLIYQYNGQGENELNPNFTTRAQKRFTAHKEYLQKFEQSVNKDEQNEKICSIQMRCVALNNSDGILTTNFPQFGHFRFNQNKKTHVYFKLQPPPNDRKRKDQPMDLTSQVLLNAEQPQFNQFSLEMMQKVDTKGDKHIKYVCGLFIVKAISPEDLTKNVELFQEVIPFKKTYDDLMKMKRELQSDSEDIQCSTNILNVSLNCLFTTMPMTTPVKGQWCDHLQCFDLSNFIQLNKKNRRWICPVKQCDKPVMLYKDEFMHQLIELAKSINAGSEGITEAIIDYKEMSVTLGTKGPFSIIESGISVDLQGNETQSEASEQSLGGGKISSPQMRPSKLSQAHSNSMTQSTSPHTESSNDQQRPNLPIKRAFSSISPSKMQYQKEEAEKRQKSMTELDKIKETQQRETTVKPSDGEVIELD